MSRTTAALSKAETNLNIPDKYRQGFEIEDDKGSGSTGAFDPAKELISTNEQILTKMGLDPETWVIEGNIHQWSKQMPDGTDRTSIFAGFHRKDENHDKTVARLASLIPQVKTQHVGSRSEWGLSRVFVISDPQVGKLDKEGGTPELLKRWSSILEQALAEVKDVRPETLVIADCGDSIENMFNYANQTTHVDLTLDQQLVQWQRMLIQAIVTLAQYANHTIITGVPSNHGEVRNGLKAQVGNGDYGIGVLHQVEDAFKQIGTELDLTFIYPDSEWDDCVSIPLDGANILFTHGHNAGTQNKIPTWIEGQAANPASRFAQATIVVTGHFHNRRYLTSHGRDIIECPTLESSSNWLYKVKGEWSVPGATMFSVYEGRLSNLHFIDERSPHE